MKQSNRGWDQTGYETKGGHLGKAEGLVTAGTPYTEVAIIRPSHNALPTCKDVQGLGHALGSADNMAAPHPLGPVLFLPNEIALWGQKHDHFAPRMIFRKPHAKPSISSTCPETPIRKMLENLYK